MDDAWWLQHIFGESLAAKNNPDAAKLAADVSPQEALGLMTRLFSNCGAHLASFTDRQVSEGLIFLGDAGENDWMYRVYEPSIDWALRVECMRSIELLYRDCFARRCRNTTTHMTSDTDSLNSVCYMWWERFPSIATDGEQVAVDAELIEVMGKTLQIEHAACQESALHGLGHWEVSNEDRVHTIIDEWLVRHPQLPFALRAYAEAARNGNVV